MLSSGQPIQTIDRLVTTELPVTITGSETAEIPNHSSQKGSPMRRKVGAVLSALALSAVMVGGTAGVAFADPDFGPGNSQKGPNDGGAKCHPPGQTVNEPGCK
jgi:hypothetical protein